MKANFIDNLVGYLSPRAGLERARARAAQAMLAEAMARKFDAAGKGRRFAGWTTSGTSANAVNAPAIAVLRDRSRDLVRNNPYASRAITVIASNTVGAGIIPQPRAAGKNKNAALLASQVWQSWGETTECDFEGVNTAYGIQALIMRELAESGEIIVRRRWVKDPGPTKIPLRLQVLEPDFIDTTKSEGRIVQGIEFDGQGRRSAYWLYPQHPGNGSGASESMRVPAEDILHLYRVDRAGQIRGIAWGAPVILRLHDFDEYEDAQLVRQKIAACFTAFVRDMEAPSDPVKAKETLGERVEPGAIELLGPGKTVEFASPPGVQGYGEYASVTLHAVAAGYGVTYEQLTGDLSQVNFSSARMGFLEFQRNVESWRWNILIPRLCAPIWEWFVSAAVLAGYRIDGVRATWTPPRREMIDPTREVPAIINAIRGGLTSQSQAIREQGYDPRELFEEMREDNRLLDELGLVLDSDARRITKGGLAQPEVQAAADEEKAATT